jgi:hypothetical protein
MPGLDSKQAKRDEREKISLNEIKMAESGKEGVRCCMHEMNKRPVSERCVS